MKKILVLPALFFLLNLHAQTDSTKVLTDTSKIKFIDPSDSTGFGTPDGQLISKEIGTAGGTIVSEDGRIELIFPADALTATTTISIQPTTNPAPNGTGKAYQFEPSGTQFKKSVQIIFHYTDEEAKICSPVLMGFAMQDHIGKWSFFDYDDWDSTAKILKGTIEHFSGHAPHVSKLKLVPAKRTIMVNEEMSFTIVDISKKFKGKKKKPSTVFSKWYVNGEEGGNNSIGTIGNIKDNSCSYKAPSMMPIPNPVAVSLKTSDGLKASCEVEIYDRYEIKINGHWFYSNPGNNDLTLEVNEGSSFIIDIEVLNSGKEGAESAIKWRVDKDKIVNDPLSVKQYKCPKECTCRFKVEKGTKGLIEIEGITDVKVSGKTVTVYFEKVEASFPFMEASCVQQLVPLVPKIPALPPKFTFQLSDIPEGKQFRFGENIFPIEYSSMVRRPKM